MDYALLCYVKFLLLFSCITANDILRVPYFSSNFLEQKKVAILGQSKILHCQAFGNPQPNYMWLKNGFPVTNFSDKYFFKIYNISHENAGEYQCIAKNELGALLSDKINLIILEPIRKIFSNVTIFARHGEAVILNLPKLNIFDKKIVVWKTGDGITLKGKKYASDTNGNLIILSCSKSDELLYRAHITLLDEEMEIISGFYEIILEEIDHMSGDLEIIVPPSSLTVNHGSFCNLKCIVNFWNLDHVEILWMKNDVLLPYTNIPFSFDDPYNRSLNLYSVEKKHAGIYTCLGSLKMDILEPVKASAEIRILEPPIVNVSFKSETLVEFNKTVRFSCDAKGLPLPTVKWFKDAKCILNTSSVIIYVNGTLEISNLNQNDSGVYQCFVSNEAEEHFYSTWLKVQSNKPTWIIMPINKTVLVGEDVIIKCRATGSPNPSVLWFKNGEPLSSERMKILESGDLIITSVNSLDTGSYNCMYKNNVGVLNASMFLTVWIKSQIILPPKNASFILGHTAKLTCQILSQSEVGFNINWYHNGRLLKEIVNDRISFLSNGSLEIQEVRATDNGNYTCELTTWGGNKSYSVFLNIIELPYSPANVNADLLPNKFVNISWIPGFDGNSQILYYILQSQKLAQFNEKYSNVIMDIESDWTTLISNVSAENKFIIVPNLKAATNYQFRLIPVNYVGRGAPSNPSNIISLPQEVPSGPPENFLGVARSNSTIVIQWQPPATDHRNGKILGYIIKYKLHGYNSPWSLRNITHEIQHTYLIENLISWKDYEITVAAYNIVGLGKFSPLIKVRTKEGVPESTPTNVRAKPLNSTSILVMWKPPDPQKINGINLGYKLKATSGAGDGKQSEPIKVQTMQDGKLLSNYIAVTIFVTPVPGPVGLIKFEKITDKSVMISWKPPSPLNGILLGYSLSYFIKENMSEVNSMNKTSDVSSVFITDLMPSTTYEFKISSWTVAGFGPVSFSTFTSGVKPVLPEPPFNLALTNIDAFSAVVQFTPGFDGNSSIIKWIVQAQMGSFQLWNNISEVYVSNATSISLNNLIPFLQYKLRIIACNIVGESKPSIPSKIFQTLQAPPAHPPYNVTARAISSTEIRARWIPLQQMDWYGNPKGYLVTYKSDNMNKSISIENQFTNSFIIKKLSPFTSYVITVQSFNDVGTSTYSPPVIEKTRETVPSSGPTYVQANATSSTTIHVIWNEIIQEHRNGLLKGYKIYFGSKDVPFMFKIIDNNLTFQSTLTELKKFTKYSIQILAYTRMGDGQLNMPPVIVETYDDLPGFPSNLSFPDVSLIMARIIWDSPEEPNGIILAYRVTYFKESNSMQKITKDLSPSTRTYRAVDLEAYCNYIFEVSAKTRLGWGQSAKALVFTTNVREIPQPPSVPLINYLHILSNEVSLNWQPSTYDIAPLRYYLIQISEKGNSWNTLSEKIHPSISQYTATNLKPCTSYQFRLRAVNDVGWSNWSRESKLVTTLPSTPSKAPQNLQVIPITISSVKVKWKPLHFIEWSGDNSSGGYGIEYNTIIDYSLMELNVNVVKVDGACKSEWILEDLLKNINYEIRIFAFNSKGKGPLSQSVLVYVGEAVPTGAPQQLHAKAVSEHEIQLFWKPPFEEKQNGNLLGYKIYYVKKNSDENIEELAVVPAMETSYSLFSLNAFTLYSIQIIAFNPAGDGPRSEFIEIYTLQGIPGPVESISFRNIAMTSVKVMWAPPLKPQGIINFYRISYKSVGFNDSEFSKEVKITVNDTQLFVQDLEERMTYIFSVRAYTIEYGPETFANVTTGPQINSPRSYHWETLSCTEEGIMEEFVIPLYHLQPATVYKFRVMSYNKYGVSSAVVAKDTLLTPLKTLALVQQLPFYRQSTFLVILASGSIIIIIIIIAVLYIKTRNEMSINSLGISRLNEELSTADFQNLKICGFQPFQNQKCLLDKASSQSSPTNVCYSDDDSEKECNRNEDDSSITEKPSEISSTDSQVTESETESDNVASFVNHYANINETLRRSWRKQKTVVQTDAPSIVPKCSSFTDSDADANCVFNLNGGKIILNNMAGSRAPLPGFSSFV